MHDTAQEALILATKAIERIEGHEKTCAERWDAVKRIQKWQVTLISGIFLCALGIAVKIWLP